MQILPHVRLRPLIRSGHWDLLVSVLKENRELLMTRLLSCEPEALGKLQGRVQELDNILNMKATLQAEEIPKK